MVIELNDVIITSRWGVMVLKSLSQMLSFKFVLSVSVTPVWSLSLEMSFIRPVFSTIQK